MTARRAGRVFLLKPLDELGIALADEPGGQALHRGIVADDQKRVRAIGEVARHFEQAAAIAEVVDAFVDDDARRGAQFLRNELPGFARAARRRAKNQFRRSASTVA